MGANTSKLIKVTHTSGVEDSILLDAETHSWHTMSAPTGYINVTGLGGQMDPSSPLTTGHYVSPRRQSDIEIASLPTVKFLKTSDTITELADSFRIDFVVSPLDENFTFDVVVKQATAASPKDYNFTKKTIQVIKNNSVNPIKANISDDSEGDGPKDLTFVIRNLVGPGTIGADSLLYLYIKDNEANAVKNFATGNIKMYPNPAADLLYIQSEFNIISAQIIGVDGKVVISQLNPAQQFSMDVNALSSGVYNVRIITDKGQAYSEPLFIK
jgi:Secretion system C-terminal sorting domain